MSDNQVAKLGWQIVMAEGIAIFGNHVTKSKQPRGMTMSQVIRISDALYKRLEAHASGFDTPSNVIESILNSFEGITSSKSTNNNSSPTSDMQPAKSLDIVYFPDSEDDFKQQLLVSKKAYLKLHYTNGTTEIKVWNASRFSPSSRVDNNLRSGYLRGWKEGGICKAELSINEKDIT